jgi:hypothetical protein
MRVLKPGQNAIDNLVSEMLFIERGTRNDARNGVPWPTITMDPITKGGLPYIIHYRPSVGVIYYTLSVEAKIKDLVESISNKLNDESHLYTVISAATPNTVMRQKSRITGGNIIVGPRKCYKKSIAEKTNLPARLLQWTPIDDLETPPHYSIHAAFTWVFMPVTVALNIENIGFNSMSVVNATVSAIFYDGADLSNFSNDDEVDMLKFVDFKHVKLPLVLESSMADILAFTKGVILIDKSGFMTYVGRALNLHTRLIKQTCINTLPEIPWDPSNIIPNVNHADDATRKNFQCISCLSPLSKGPVVLLIGEEYQKKTLLCKFCWAALDPQITVPGGATHTIFPYSQVETAAACPGYEVISKIISGKAAPLDNSEGAFVVSFDDSSNNNIPNIIIAGKNLGHYPSITNIAISTSGLAVIPKLALALIN